MLSYKEFSTKLRKIRTHRTAKVRNSFGVYDCYKKIRKKGWMDIGRPLKEKEFYSIIRRVNNLYAKELAEGKEMLFPNRMGKLELRKFPVGVSLVNGKLKNTYPIDWDSTIRLWYEDEESRGNKTLLRHEIPYTYHIKYNKFAANYENKSFYEFVLNRFVKRALKDNLQKGKIDTLW